MNTHDTLPRWTEAMLKAWGAVPAGGLLDPESQVWELLKLPPPNMAEAASLALVGRSLKYCQSVGIALPLLNGDVVTRLMVYLHRLRLDALQGGIRSPWLNPRNMEDNPDIVFISRPRTGLQELSRVVPLHARILRSGRIKADKEPHTSETLVVDGASDLMEMTDLIEKESHPFVMVIDGTRGGNEGIGSIENAMAEYFPETPRIVLLSLGDNEAISKVRSNSSNTHLWIMRLEDQAAISSLASTRQIFQMGLIGDDIANTALKNIAAQFVKLRQELETNKDFALKERLAIIGKVFRALNELVVPLPNLESALQEATRPGLFPVRCLERWLDIANQGSCRFGQTEMDSRRLITQVQSLHSLLMKSISGKTGWLHECLRNAQINKIKIMVLCGSPHEVTALENWLDDTLAHDWDETTYIVAMDGVKSYRQQRTAIDEVIVAGMLWPSRQHWLATPCQKMTIPVYAYEATQMERQIQFWWAKNGAASRSDGDKLRHWQLDWSAGRCKDEETSGIPLALEFIKCADHSKYPPSLIHTVVPVKMELDNWLDLLLEEPVLPSSTVERGESLNPDLVWINIEENERSLPWSKSSRVLVLKNAEIVPTLPNFLEAGDQIILLKQTEERLATQEKLFDMVAESEGMQQLVKASNRWRTLVNTVAANFKPHQVQPYLQLESINITNAAITNWYNHKVYGPRDRAAVLVFARLAGVKEPEKVALYISNGIEEIRRMHQHVGQQLRKALLDRSRGAATITIGTLTLDGCSFDEMIELATVVSVHQPTIQVVAAPKKDELTEIAEAIMSQFPNRLYFTTPALKSMSDSIYRDMSKFRACLQLMATELYLNYKEKHLRLHDVLNHFTKELIEFRPKMSNITMGKYFDNRQYKNRPADMNRHFCLGNARDAMRTLRIHFEWDEQDQLIVIHHAGKHLETTQS